MNHYLKIVLSLFTLITFASCSDEFLTDRLNPSGVSISNIIISPEWDACDYEFKCKGLKDEDFIIDCKPDWLVLDSNSGKFKDSLATIHCSANMETKFSRIGLYFDQMIISTTNKTFAIPVYYITEGNPSAQINQTFEISYNKNNQLLISNSGNGILLWKILSMPSWLTVNMYQFRQESVMLGQGASASIPFILNSQAAEQNGLKGTLVVKTNDKNNPLVKIAVSVNL